MTYLFLYGRRNNEILLPLYFTTISITIINNFFESTVLKRKRKKQNPKKRCYLSQFYQGIGKIFNLPLWNFMYAPYISCRLVSFSQRILQFPIITCLFCFDVPSTHRERKRHIHSFISICLTSLSFLSLISLLSQHWSDQKLVSSLFSVMHCLNTHTPSEALFFSQVKMLLLCSFDLITD